jgi:hypothetical protein
MPYVANHCEVFTRRDCEDVYDFITVVKAGSVAFAATRLKVAKSGRTAATTFPILPRKPRGGDTYVAL